MSKAKQLERVRAKTEIEAFINIQYDKLQNRCAGYGKPKYKNLDLISREEFKCWSKDREDLIELFKQWISKSNELRFRPTVDRIDSNKGYTINNIRWLSQRENSALGGKQNYKVR